MFPKNFLYYLYYSVVWNKVTYFYLYLLYFANLLYFDESHQGVMVFYWKERLTQAVLNKTNFKRRQNCELLGKCVDGK